MIVASLAHHRAPGLSLDCIGENGGIANAGADRLGRAVGRTALVGRNFGQLLPITPEAECDGNEAHQAAIAGAHWIGNPANGSPVQVSG
jgi:hypothetical protein